MAADTASILYRKDVNENGKSDVNENGKSD